MNFAEDLRLFFHRKILIEICILKIIMRSGESINILPMIDIIFAILSFHIISR